MISEQTKEYFELGKRNDVREHAKRLRRQFLRYKDAEIVYSIHHKKLLEMANKAGAGRQDSEAADGGGRADGRAGRVHLPGVFERAH